MRTIIFLFAFGLTALVANAQTTTKVGYADPDYIMGQLPEAKQIETEMKSLQTQLKTQIDAKYQKFQKDLADYQANAATMIDAVKTNTERELQQQQQNLEKLQQDAQTTIQNKQALLISPVQLKIGKAVEEVAKENGFTLILSSQVGGLDVVLYADEKVDISDLVLKKLGVTPKPKTTAPVTPAPK